MYNLHVILSFLSLCCLIKGQVSTDTQLRRKRLSLDTLNETSLGTSITNYFGKIMHGPSKLNDRAEGFKEWSRIVEDTSFIFTSECTFDLKLECYLASDKNISCNDYMNKLSSDLSLECKEDIVVEYSITNIGKVEETVDNIKTSFNGERPFVSVVDELSIQDRILLPGQTVRSTKQYSLDFCSTYQASDENSLLFEIEVDCVSGETHISSFNYSFERFPSPECLVDLDISCETLDGGPCLGKRPSNGLCTFRPFYFDFLLSAGTCAESVNEQDSGRFSCVDHYDISSFSQVFVVVDGVKKRKHYFSGVVSRNEIFTIGNGFKVESDLSVSIYSHPGGILIQTLRFHSSCSKNLSLGDTFGAVTIAGFRDKSHDLTFGQVASGSTAYNIYYTISNKGQYEVQVENLVFTAEGNRTIAVVISDGITIKSANTMTGKVTVLNMTAYQFETSASLNYRTLPLFASKDCKVVDHYEASSCSEKGPNSKGSKGSGKCTGKGSKSSSKSYRSIGKGSSSSKSSKGVFRSKGKGGAASSRKSSKFPSKSSSKGSPHSKSTSSKKAENISSWSKKGSYKHHPEVKSPKSLSEKSPSSSKKGSSKASSNSSSKGKSDSKSTSSKSAKSPSESSKVSSSSKGKSDSKSTSSKSAKSPSSSKKESSIASSNNSSKGSPHSKSTSSKSAKSPSSSKKRSSKASSKSSSKGSSMSYSSSTSSSSKHSDKNGRKGSSYSKSSPSSNKLSSNSGSNGKSDSKSTSSKSGKSPSLAKKGSSKASSDSGSKGKSDSKSTSSKSGKSPSLAKKGSSKASSDSGSKGKSDSKSTSSKSGKMSNSSKKRSPKVVSKGKSNSKSTSSKSEKKSSLSKKGSSKLARNSGSKGLHRSKLTSDSSKLSSDNFSKGSSYSESTSSSSKVSSNSGSKGKSESTTLSKSRKSQTPSKKVEPHNISSNSVTKELYPSKAKSSKSKSGKTSGSSKKDSAHLKGKGKKKSRTRNMK